MAQGRCPGGGLCAIIPPAIFREAFALKLNLVHTVAFSGVVLFAGYGLRKFIKPLARYIIPFR
jgi:hypothetical protein